MANQLPRFMIVVWRWRDSTTYRLDEKQNSREWQLDQPPNAANHDEEDDKKTIQNAADRFIQLDKEAGKETTQTLAELIAPLLQRGNVLLFLHDHPQYGYTAESKGEIMEAVSRQLQSGRAGHLYIRLFTGGQMHIYATPNFRWGILGEDGNFAHRLEDYSFAETIVKHNNERRLSHLHFNAVWNHYWQKAQIRERIGYLKNLYWFWMLGFDNPPRQAKEYLNYLCENLELYSALASFCREEIEDELPNYPLLDFSEIEDSLRFIFPSSENGADSLEIKDFLKLQEDIQLKVFRVNPENTDELTLDIVNRLEKLYWSIPSENFN